MPMRHHLTSHLPPTSRTDQIHLRASTTGLTARWPLLALAVCLSSAAQAEQVIGFVRDAQSQRYLYTEVHDLQRSSDGAVQTGLTIYYDAQGKEMARKTLDYRANRTVPVYRLDIPAMKYTEGISANKGSAQVFKVDNGQEERKALPLNEGAIAADSGFNQLILDAWPKIVQGETVKFSLIAAGRTASYSFRARKQGETTAAGQRATQVLVEPDSMLRFVVAPIELTYDSKGSKLLSYKGVSNILNPETGKVYKLVQISYDTPPPPEAKWPGAQ